VNEKIGEIMNYRIFAILFAVLFIASCATRIGGPVIDPGEIVYLGADEGVEAYVIESWEEVLLQISVPFSNVDEEPMKEAIEKYSAEVGATIYDTDELYFMVYFIVPVLDEDPAIIVSQALLNDNLMILTILMSKADFELEKADYYADYVKELYLISHQFR
jgi:hypothetical protein